MDKMQILFPEPQLRRLRSLAKRQDRPVSEIVRSAVDLWLSRYGSEVKDQAAESAPVFSCGTILVDSGDLREIAYKERG